MVTRRARSRPDLRRIGGSSGRVAIGRPRCTGRRELAPRGAPGGQDDDCSARLMARASSAAVQADSSTPPRDAHSRRASGPLPALAQADPISHPGWSCRSFARSSPMPLVWSSLTRRVYTGVIRCRYVMLSLARYSRLMFTADVPRWRQLADLIKERIAAGLYQPRQPIPSEHALVQETGLSRSTVQKALRSLRDEGVVYSVQGLGTFVSPPG